MDIFHCMHPDQVTTRAKKKKKADRYSKILAELRETSRIVKSSYLDELRHTEVSFYSKQNSNGPRTLTYQFGILPHPPRYTWPFFPSRFLVLCYICYVVQAGIFILLSIS